MKIHSPLHKNSPGLFRNRLRLISFFIFFLFLSQKLSAQYYQTGQDPASIKWLQIKTSRFTIIYPESYGPEGIKYARSLDEAYSKLITLFPEKKFRIPVIIHNYTIQSNGYVAWAPKRIELYPTPEQNTIPLSPETELSTHELTHVFQMESLNQGFSKYMTYIFGEQFTGAVASLIPSWFLEGDAVFAESILTPSGRGRTPSFQKPLKALVVDNKKAYSYDKILNGSYRDFVPDYYVSGFDMTTTGLLRNDPQLWNKVLKFTADEPFTINPFNISLTRNANLKKKKLWKETYDTLRSVWTKDIPDDELSSKQMNPDKKGKYINYYSPIYLSHDSIIAIKTSLSDPASFVIINPEKRTEKWLLTPGQVYPRVISFGNNKLVWVETQLDPRWENREYSVIKVMDVKHRSLRKLTGRSRFLSVAVSPDGMRIAAIENSVSNKNTLMLISTLTGDNELTIPVPDNTSLQHPQWSEDGEKITFISLNEAGEGVISFIPEGQKWETLIVPGRSDLQSSFLRNDTLFFVSSASGTDNLFICTKDNRIDAVTNSRFGISDISQGGRKSKSILFSNYTVQGNEICSVRSLKSSGILKEYKNKSSFPLNRFDSKPPSQTLYSDYTPQPYRKWQHLFRFHSWMPFYADIAELKVNPRTVRPGFTVLTQNSLSTLTSSIGYEYSADRRNVIHSRITWNGWYPVLESQLDYGLAPLIYKFGEKVSNPSQVQPGFSFVNTLSLPIHFNTGKYSQVFDPSVSANYVNQYIYNKQRGTYEYGQTIITGRFYFANYHVSSIRDIFPRWAQMVDLNYCFAPFNKTIYGSELSVKTAFYFPGLLSNNGIRLRFETEKQETEKYLYGNFSNLPRGYSNIIATELNFISADYALPLIYPDLNLASFLYIKRVRADLFYDYAEGPGSSFFRNTSRGLEHVYNSTENKTFSSYGIELMTDFHLFRIPYMISGGVQAAWKDINETPVFGFLFNINLFGMNLGGLGKR